jgi:SAM-dependent methyltransferase
MPPAPDRRQPESPAAAWFRRDATLRLLDEVQRQVVPDLTRVFGHTGLYLRPTAAQPPVLSGNLLANVVSLHREGSGFGGELRCQDAGLPFPDGTLALVYALFVFETSPDPAGLLREMARVLKPEGVALIVSLNPSGLARLRWMSRGLRCTGRAAFAGDVVEAGLDVQRKRCVGPFWSADDGMDPVPRTRNGLLSPLRIASLVVARRRDPGVTPLRAMSPALKLRPGMSAG